MIMKRITVNGGDILAKAMGTATTRGRGSMVLLTRLAREVYRASSEEILGMRFKQYALLGDLRDSEGAMPQQALCGALHLDPNNLVLMLNELEDAGYIERRRDPEDRRRHIVELTAAGERALERAEKGMESVEDQVLAPLDREQRAELRKLLAMALSDGEDSATSAAASESQAAASAAH
jgi:MarR family transcriptional regulator, temperature-dependent positive regulator of motility